MSKAAVLAVLLLLGGTAHQELDSSALQREFPQQDSQIVSLLTTARAAADAAEKLKRAPAEMETVRALMRTGDHAGLLQSLQLIVDTHPERMAAAFEEIHGR